MKRKTLSEFISEARAIHGNKYDYSKVKYINSNTKVCIICPKHGEFWKTPGNHIHGKQGCMECIKEKKTENFISEARAIHGDKYDYSLVNYINDKTKVDIICPTHGIFQQTPSLHILQKCGCPKCVGKNKTLEELIKRAIEIHGDKYDFSLANTNKTHDEIKVKCNSCGRIFDTSFSKLMHSKQGCKYCTHRSFKYTTEEFIERARKIHDDKYDYSKVNYINNKTKVDIICPIHGVFPQTPHKHVNEKQGCPFCSKSHKMSTEEFVEKANLIHGNRFVYDKTDLENRDEKGRVIITCPIHGDFLQTPHGHLSGKGCKQCSEEHNINETVLYNFLSNNLPKYTLIREYNDTFLGKQTLDVFIKELNIGIEYQGMQHFKSVKHFGGEEKYKYTVEMDKKKKKKCDENGIKLFYFSKEKNLPKEYLDTIYSNNENLLKKIKKYDNNR